MKIYRNAFALGRSRLSMFKRIPYQVAPDFLGEFSQRRYSAHHRLPSAFVGLVARLAQFCPEQEFNTVFIQRYRKDEYVAQHRDPVSNKGHTLIAIFGLFEGAVTKIEGEEPFRLGHGDVLKLPCTIDGVQGPWHAVSPVTLGTRYAVILNTIER